jgi:hypothetical protein
LTLPAVVVPRIVVTAKVAIISLRIILLFLSVIRAKVPSEEITTLVAPFNLAFVPMPFADPAVVVPMRVATSAVETVICLNKLFVTSGTRT